ncbi:hypothetical protein B0A48_18858 [Cryoendolithus antarcticus]|uniref:DUF7924 domain-containing protein n=1 Tax=Cryoendolithus antarcticus TaxID=1507870 RepID=A0A1V8S7I8_9PEZI|nr:hypothetical protein B0A48_18858 [Cryoendolithus antarcticus]
MNLLDTLAILDVTPWVVPSAENLFFSGVPGLDGIGGEINAEWVRCEPMGLSRPKPDFTVGLRRSAFRNEELEKLENYGTPQNPFYFTPDLSFPFLICEAKIGRIGIDQADTENIHSASIATKAIVSLYVAAFGREHEKTKALLGRVFVFTVSHNNRIVNLNGHYAVAGMNSSDDDGDDTLDKLLRQLQELGQHSRDKEERMERLMDQQKMESKEQLERQRKESKEQLEQLTGVISRLQESRDIS